MEYTKRKLVMDVLTFYPRNLIPCILTKGEIHLKVQCWSKSVWLHLDLRSLSPALHNLWLFNTSAIYSGSLKFYCYWGIECQLFQWVWHCYSIYWFVVSTCHCTDQFMVILFSKLRIKLGLKPLEIPDSSADTEGKVHLCTIYVTGQFWFQVEVF